MYEGLQLESYKLLEIKYEILLTATLNHNNMILHYIKCSFLEII
jgi:hypothetical protein